MSEQDVFNGLGIEISLKDDKDFNSIVETLTRIGYASRHKNILYQSCHLFHKRGYYAIVHFKEMFMFDGKTADISDSDIARRNKITKYLEQWGLLSIMENEDVDSFADVDPGFIKIIPFKEKDNWELVQKYTIGNKK